LAQNRPTQGCLLVGQYYFAFDLEAPFRRAVRDRLQSSDTRQVPPIGAAAATTTPKGSVTNGGGSEQALSGPFGPADESGCLMRFPPVGLFDLITAEVVLFVHFIRTSTGMI
jgi:hypothetical protein